MARRAVQLSSCIHTCIRNGRPYHTPTLPAQGVLLVSLNKLLSVIHKPIQGEPSGSMGVVYEGAAGAHDYCMNKRALSRTSPPCFGGTFGCRSKRFRDLGIWVFGVCGSEGLGAGRVLAEFQEDLEHRASLQRASPVSGRPQIVEKRSHKQRTLDSLPQPQT